MTKESITDILVELGRRLGFRVGTEIQASDSAWVDVVWFDERFDFGPRKEESGLRLRRGGSPFFLLLALKLKPQLGQNH